MKTVENGERKLYLDCVRVLAILLVIFNHTGTFGYFRFAETGHAALYWIYMACSILCTMGVPLFFMVSGALLLRREETIGALYRKRVLRMTLVLLLFSLLLYGYQVRFQGAERDFLRFLTVLYTGQIVPAYWFLYAYLGLLLMLPLLRRMAGGMRRADYRYLVIVYALFTGVLPIVQYLLCKREFAINLSIPLIATSSVFFCLLGNACDRFASEEVTKKRLLLLVAASVVSVAVCAVMTHYKARITGVLSEEASQTFFARLNFVPAITVFLFLKKRFAVWQCPRALASAIRSMGSCTFGVYLLHPIWMDRLMPALYFLRERIDTFPACILYVLMVFLCGYATTWLLKRIPGIRRLL